ncbi:Glucan 1,3-beta-glucosidase 3 [Tilletia horrida]|nr:Glucan 1,3-beta-glucosidase 3 [Tilletia horrida]
MKFLPRDTADLFKIATSLSLAVANYKPVPLVPNANDLVVNASIPSGANRFQTITGQPDASDWGVPSTLNLSTPVASPLHLAAQSTIGPGNCPIQTQAYTPIGGWEALPPPLFAPFDPVRANIMRYRQQQGVNLGSWFAQENWMEWSLFSCAVDGKAGELDLLGGWGKSASGVANATAFLEKHWDTWIREDDFAKLAAIGINTVRIPIGHWSVGPFYALNSRFEPWADVYQFSWRYIARAINWAAKYDIGVILDLHGAYGSQNGQSHSGISDGSIDFFQPANMKRTTDLLVWMANEISDVTNIVGIQLLNEPVDRAELWPWYNDTMNAMRNASSYAATVPLYFHDAFKLEKGAKFVANRTDFVVQDHHSYYVYTPSDIALSAKAHIRQISGRISDWMSGQSDIARRNLIVGEWSCALAQNSKDQSSDPEGDQRRFCEAQKDVYAATSAGWTFWSYKMENCDRNAGWCFQSAVNKYLSRTFDAWGLGTVAPLLYNASSVEAKMASTNILNALRDIQLPASALQLFRADNSSTTEQDIANGIATTFESDDQSGSRVLNSTAANKTLATTSTLSSAKTPATPKSLLARPFIGKVMSPAAAASSSEEDSSSNFDAVPNTNNAQRRRSIAEKRGVGSPGARAAALVARDRMQAQKRAAALTSLVNKSGYSDGFMSAKIFASSIGLSRIGFIEQYIADSWDARVDSGKIAAGFSKTDVNSYKKQFRAGLKDAESAIIQAVQTTLATAGGSTTASS